MRTLTLRAVALIFGVWSSGCMMPDHAAPTFASQEPQFLPQSLRSSSEARAQAPDAIDSGEQFAWQDRTSSPRPGVATNHALQELLALCDASDLALGNVAARIARRQADSLPALDMAQIAFALRSEGAPYVWPRAWSVEGGKLEQADVIARMKRWLGSFSDGGQRRCGAATVTSNGGKRVVAALALDALADLGPVPTRARTGEWITVEARMLVPTTEAKVIVLGPAGPPHSVISSLSSGIVRARFSADKPGPWVVQVLATVVGGPRPVLEAMVHVDEAPPETFHARAAPGEEAADAAPDERSAIHLMVDAARSSERLARLKRDERLDRVAQAHAEAMQKARRIGHDIGDGDPQSRVEAVGLGMRAAGENVAHAANLRRAHRALWASPSHRGNVLHRRFDSIGIGISNDPDGTVWVCEVFADAR